MKFEVYNRRHNSNITYIVNKTNEGWHIDYVAINGDCDREGKPYFYTNFNQDYIEYPADFGDYLSSLWSLIDDEHIDRSEAQHKLQELADWVSICEKSVPEWKAY